MSKNDDDDDPPLSDTTPFALLSDETRQDIVRAAAAEMPDGEPVAFTDIRHRAGVADPGRFRYHVDKLLGTLLVRMDERYFARYGTLRQAIGLSAAELSGEEQYLKPVPTQFECPYCEKYTRASYGLLESSHLVCPTHGTVFWQEVPPTVDSTDPIDIAEYAIRMMHHDTELVAEEVCPWCQSNARSVLRWGRFTYSSFADPPDDVTPLWARHTCETCLYEGWFPAGVQAATDSEVRAFFTRHGIDVRAHPFPHKYLAETTVLDTEEGVRVEAEFTYAIGDNSIRAHLNKDARVIDVIS